MAYFNELSLDRIDSLNHKAAWIWIAAPFCTRLFATGSTESADVEPWTSGWPRHAARLPPARWPGRAERELYRDATAFCLPCPPPPRALPCSRCSWWTTRWAPPCPAHCRKASRRGPGERKKQTTLTLTLSVSVSLLPACVASARYYFDGQTILKPGVMGDSAILILRGEVTERDWHE